MVVSSQNCQHEGNFRQTYEQCRGNFDLHSVLRTKNKGSKRLFVKKKISSII